MDTRRKIYDLLTKISSERDLIRIYKFMQYVYLHTSGGTELKSFVLRFFYIQFYLIGNYFFNLSNTYAFTLSRSSFGNDI